MLVHPVSWRPPQGPVWNGYWLGYGWLWFASRGRHDQSQQHDGFRVETLGLSDEHVVVKSVSEMMACEQVVKTQAELAVSNKMEDFQEDRRKNVFPKHKARLRRSRCVLKRRRSRSLDGFSHRKKGPKKKRGMKKIGVKSGKRRADEEKVIPECVYNPLTGDSYQEQIGAGRTAFNCTATKNTSQF